MCVVNSIRCFGRDTCFTLDLITSAAASATAGSKSEERKDHQYFRKFH
jgi:hypothetical protein